MQRKSHARTQDQPSGKAQTESDADHAPLRDSASQIWLAGLGAFAKAQEEGSRMFDALVREGTAIQRRTQTATEETLSEAAQRIAAMAGDISSHATGQWGRLETLFEDRVGRALEHLGVAKAADIAQLAHRVDALEQQASRPPRAAARKVARPPAPQAAAAAQGSRRQSAPRRKAKGKT